jgi:hypothetical protein
MNNVTGSTLPLGAWVVVSGSTNIAAGATHRWPEVVGVLTASLTTANHDLIRSTGIAPALCLGPMTAGDLLVLAGSTYTSFGDGYAISATLGPSGNLLATLGIEIGMALGAIAASTTGLVTCMIFR